MRAVTPGSFALPAVNVSDMYAPRVYGRTAMGRVDDRAALMMRLRRPPRRLWRSPPPSLAAGALALDRIFPPDLSRYHDRSTEIVDANGRLLRAFTTADGKWRLKTTVDDVDPVYLALLKAYEDRRFDDHLGRRSAGGGARRRAVDHAAAASCRAPRRSPCRPPACSSPTAAQPSSPR